MTAGLDAPHRAGALRIAALSERFVAAAGSGAGGCVGTKRPVAILVMRDHRITAFDLLGREISVANLRRLYPELISRFAAGAEEDVERWPD